GPTATARARRAAPGSGPRPRRGCRRPGARPRRGGPPRRPPATAHPHAPPRRSRAAAYPRTVLAAPGSVPFTERSPRRTRSSMDPAPDRLRPVLAGLVTALVGFTSSFAVVLAGLRAVGATPDQAASGLLALCVTQGAGILWLTWRHRTPLTLAWSTPGAALLVSTGAVTGGWPAAVGAFCVVGALVLLTALWPRLGDLVAAIPTPIAQAMLAGVLLTLCLAPVRSLVATPLLVAPAVLTWLVLLRVAPRWAAPAALAVTLAVVGYEAVDGGTLAWSDAVPRLDLTTPSLSWQAVVGLAVPLCVVTMASQNVPGVAVMASFGYRVPWRESMTVTGLATLAGATAG